MPIYEYECPKCGRFDTLQKMSEPALTTHDSCGSPVTKLMSAGAFSFKGSGFYITDYARKSSSLPEKSGGDKPSGEKPSSDKPKGDGCQGCSQQSSSGECKAA
jgi:putative FmdB family regulatory protein